MTEIDINETQTAVKIGDDVVSVIAGLAATEIEGVAGMSGGIAGGIAELLGKKNLAKGVKVEVREADVSVHLYVILYYGVKIPEVAQKIQQNVKTAIENMTGLSVAEVNVNVQGIAFPDVKTDVEEVSEEV